MNFEGVQSFVLSLLLLLIRIQRKLVRGRSDILLKRKVLPIRRRRLGLLHHSVTCFPGSPMYDPVKKLRLQVTMRISGSADQHHCCCFGNYSLHVHGAYPHSYSAMSRHTLYPTAHWDSKDYTKLLRMINTSREKIYILSDIYLYILMLIIDIGNNQRQDNSVASWIE